jgi:hypothetical protein
MVEKSLLFSQSLKHVGFWNFKDLYNFCFEWLKNEGYIVSEDDYQEKITDRGKEIIIKWTVWRKISDYFKYEIKVDWHILGMQDAEVKRGEKTEKTNKGEVKFTFKPFLVRDYESRWEVSPLYKFFRGIYDNYIVRTTIDDYEDRLIDKTISFIEQIKAFLVLESKK